MLQRKTQSSDIQSFKEVLGDFKMSTACWRTERLENFGCQDFCIFSVHLLDKTRVSEDKH